MEDAKHVDQFLEVQGASSVMAAELNNATCKRIALELWGCQDFLQPVYNS